MKPQSQGEKVGITKMLKDAAGTLDFKKHVEMAVQACAIDGDSAYSWVRAVGKVGVELMTFAESGRGENCG